MIRDMFPFLYGYIWPAFIAAPAVGLFLLYLFGERSPGLLVPIGVLFTITATCFFSELLNLWGILWPGFIMAPAVGLFLLYIADDNRKTGLLVPIFILGGISLVFFSIFTLGHFGGYFKYIAGGALIIAGISTIIKRPSQDYLITGITKFTKHGQFKNARFFYERKGFGKADTLLLGAPSTTYICLVITSTFSEFSGAFFI